MPAASRSRPTTTRAGRRASNRRAMPRADGMPTACNGSSSTRTIPGVYVPSLYEVSYNADGTVHAYTPVYDDIPKKVTKQIIRDLDKVYFPDRVVMPYIETVHDRIMLEVYRGCIRGCRFCQAGMIYRPVREKTP